MTTGCTLFLALFCARSFATVRPSTELSRSGPSCPNSATRYVAMKESPWKFRARRAHLSIEPLDGSPSWRGHQQIFRLRKNFDRISPNADPNEPPRGITVSVPRRFPRAPTLKAVRSLHESVSEIDRHFARFVFVQPMLGDEAREERAIDA